MARGASLRILAAAALAALAGRDASAGCTPGTMVFDPDQGKMVYCQGGSPASSSSSGGSRTPTVPKPKPQGPPCGEVGVPCHPSNSDRHSAVITAPPSTPAIAQPAQNHEKSDGVSQAARDYQEKRKSPRFQLPAGKRALDLDAYIDRENAAFLKFLASRGLSADKMDLEELAIARQQFYANLMASQEANRLLRFPDPKDRQTSVDKFLWVFAEGAANLGGGLAGIPAKSIDSISFGLTHFAPAARDGAKSAILGEEKKYVRPPVNTPEQAAERRQKSEESPVDLGIKISPGDYKGAVMTGSIKALAGGSYAPPSVSPDGFHPAQLPPLNAQITIKFGDKALGYVGDALLNVFTFGQHNKKSKSP